MASQPAEINEKHSSVHIEDEKRPAVENTTVHHYVAETDEEKALDKKINFKLDFTVLWLDARNEDSVKRSLASFASKIFKSQALEPHRASSLAHSAKIEPLGLPLSDSCGPPVRA